MKTTLKDIDNDPNLRKHWYLTRGLPWCWNERECQEYIEKLEALLSESTRGMAVLRDHNAELIETNRAQESRIDALRRYLTEKIETVRRLEADLAEATRRYRADEEILDSITRQICEKDEKHIDVTEIAKRFKAMKTDLARWKGEAGRMAEENQQRIERDWGPFPTGTEPWKQDPDWRAAQQVKEQAR